jgi:Ca2+-binding EF-hand superfamily protein
MKLIPELAVNPLGNRIIEAFFIDDDDSSVSLEQINFRQFVCILARFRRLRSHKVEETSYNTVEQKIDFVFRVYDVDRDGYISKDDLCQVLRAMVGLHVSEEQLKSIVRRTLNEADTDNDRKISREEFEKALADVDITGKMTIGFLHT